MNYYDDRLKILFFDCDPYDVKEGGLDRSHRSPTFSTLLNMKHRNSLEQIRKNTHSLRKMVMKRILFYKYSTFISSSY